MRTPLKIPTLHEIRDAAANIKGMAVRTPLVRLNWTPPENPLLEIYLKLESLQPICSFKVRPAANAIHNLEKKCNVCTASAGNFGQGLAWCATAAGISCTVVIPTSTPVTKIEAMKRLGANIIKVEYEDWWKIIETHECPQVSPDTVFIHPGCETSVLAGNATIGLEILEDLPDTDCIFAPHGSGSMVTGIACAIKAMGKDKTCNVIGVEPDTASPFTRAMNEYKLNLNDRQDKKSTLGLGSYTPSFVDGCGGKNILPEMFQITKDVVDDACAMPLSKIADAVLLIAERNKIIAEGAGACGVAAALAGVAKDAKKVVCVVSGGGIDTEDLVWILQRRGVPKSKNYFHRFLFSYFQLGILLMLSSAIIGSVLQWNHSSIGKQYL